MQNADALRIWMYALDCKHCQALPAYVHTMLKDGAAEV